MDMLNNFLDWIFYSVIEPLFSLIAQLFYLALLKPMAMLGLPVSLQVFLVAALTASLSFAIRCWLKVDTQEKEFTKEFSSKKKQQENVKFISDWKSREAMYRTMDNNLDEDFNTYLAHRFFRYVTTYMLPIFLVLAWLNSFLSEEILRASMGTHYIVPLPMANGEIEGMNVTMVFLCAYIVCLVAGFQIKKYLHRKKAADKTPKGSVNFLANS